MSVEELRNMLAQHFTRILRKHLSSYLRVRCFSALNKEETLNNVIFSHYGDSHKGLCFIFDADILVPINERQSLTEVRYSSKSPSFEFTDEFDKFSQEKLYEIGCEMVSVKYQDWKYEEEWRLFADTEYPDKIHETMEFKPKALEGIVLGLKTTKEDEERIVNLVEKRSTKIAIYRATQVAGSYNLGFKNNRIF